MKVRPRPRHPDEITATTLEGHFYDAITDHLPQAQWDESHPTENVLTVRNDVGEQRFIVRVHVEEVDTREP